MERKDIAKAFIELGKQLRENTIEKDGELYILAHQGNVWFTADNVEKALLSIGEMLSEDSLNTWLNKYEDKGIFDKYVGLVLAGNIPAVGFHDILCVLLSGYHAKIKLSSQDTVLIKFLLNKLIEIYPAMDFRISYTDKLELDELSAVIATGSNNTSRHFKQYFSKVPNIIRKNRISIAVLNGEESRDELHNLGEDILQYFGLGCRNVSKLLVPKGYKFDTFYESIEDLTGVLQNSRYSNNYDYNKSIYLVNRWEHLDNGFLVVTKSDQMVSPISVVFYEEYESQSDIDRFIADNKDQIQCVVGTGKIALGQAQSPAIDDYADGVDTMQFLGEL